MLFFSSNQNVSQYVLTVFPDLWVLWWLVRQCTGDGCCPLACEQTTAAVSIFERFCFFFSNSLSTVKNKNHYSQRFIETKQCERDAEGRTGNNEGWCIKKFFLPLVVVATEGKDIWIFFHRHFHCGRLKNMKEIPSPPTTKTISEYKRIKLTI